MKGAGSLLVLLPQFGVQREGVWYATTPDIFFGGGGFYHLKDVDCWKRVVS